MAGQVVTAATFAANGAFQIILKLRVANVIIDLHSATQGDLFETGAHWLLSLCVEYLLVLARAHAISDGAKYALVVGQSPVQLLVLSCQWGLPQAAVVTESILASIFKSLPNVFISFWDLL